MGTAINNASSGLRTLTQPPSIPNGEPGFFDPDFPEFVAAPAL